MKNYFLLSALFISVIGGTYAQNIRVVKATDFDEVVVQGNVRLYLEYADSPAVTLEARKDYYLDEYTAEVPFMWNTLNLVSVAPPKLKFFWRIPVSAP